MLEWGACSWFCMIANFQTQMWNVCRTVSPSWFVVIAALLALTYPPTVRADGTTNLLDPSPVTFESFLSHPPEIARAVFEIRNTPFGQNSPSHDAANTHKGSIKFDGTNYIVDRFEAVAEGEYHDITGRLGDVLWNYTRAPSQRLGILRKFDPSLGPKTFTWGGLEDIAKTPIRRLVNLGMVDMVPGTLVWDKSNSNQFSADFRIELLQPLPGVPDDGPGKVSSPSISQGKMMVQLHYESGVPISASVQERGKGDFLSNGKYSVRYKYDPDFYHGRLPVEFAMFDSDGTNFIARFNQLDLSPKHLASSEFDPDEVLKGTFIRSILVTSNGVTYAQRPARLGQPAVLVPPMTPEAYQASLKLGPGRTGVILAIRVGLFCAVIVPPLWMFYVRRRRRVNGGATVL